MEHIKSNVNYFDINLALKYLANNHSLLIKLGKMFVANYKDFLNDINKDTYERIHSLKGITLNIGAKVLYNECENVLQKIKKGEEYSLDSFTECFIKTYNQLDAFINQN